MKQLKKILTLLVRNKVWKVIKVKVRKKIMQKIRLKRKNKKKKKSFHSKNWENKQRQINHMIKWDLWYFKEYLDILKYWIQNHGKSQMNVGCATNGNIH